MVAFVHCSLLILPEQLEREDAGTFVGPATKLAFLKQPNDITVGSFFDPTIEIAAVNDSGSVDQNFSGAITLEAEDEGAQLLGPNTSMMQDGRVLWPSTTMLPGGSRRVTFSRSKR